MVRQVGLLKWLRTRYGVSSVVVPEVENEVVWHRKFSNRFEQDFKKSVSTGVIAVFNYSQPELHLSSILTPPQVTVAVRAIMNTAKDYAFRVGAGEAYSHAACVHLGMPMLSHDKNAIDTLLACRLKTAAPVLRVFDLIGLAYRQNRLVEKQCDLVRQTLSQAGEFVPGAFKNASFERGLKSYDQRLFDRAGSGAPSVCQQFDSPLFLAQVANLC
jgi:hypothetical protein